MDIVQAYHENNTKNVKVGVGFDNENSKGKKEAFKKNKGTCENKDVPKILKNVDRPLFKKITLEFDENLMVIKQQFLDGDEASKNASSFPKTEDAIKSKTKHIESVKTVTASEKRKHNRNGK